MLTSPPLFHGEVPAHFPHTLPRAYLITPRRLTPAKTAAESPTVSRIIRLQHPTLKLDAQLSTVLRAVPLAAGVRDTLLSAVLWRSPLDAARRLYGPGIVGTHRQSFLSFTFSGQAFGIVEHTMDMGTGFQASRDSSIVLGGRRF
jgi:hypothetical protein